MICVRAMRSSLALKKGYLPLSRESRITPADQMSMAVPWLGHLVRTSGALKPGVPALGATCCFLDIQMLQTLSVE